MDENPYQSPATEVNREDPPQSRAGQRVAKAIGTAVGTLGLVTLVYGAVAFWLIQSLPPNSGMSGRLPSLYVMGAGIVLVLGGLAARDLRLAGRTRRQDGPSKAIPTGVGMLVLLVIIIALVVAISRS